LTGRDPLGHGAVLLGEGLREGIPTLAEVLHANGYRTLSFDIHVISGQVIPYQGRMAWVR
jgi:arylsulfatase A-like enzyme